MQLLESSCFMIYEHNVLEDILIYGVQFVGDAGPFLGNSLMVVLVSGYCWRWTCHFLCIILSM